MLYNFFNDNGPNLRCLKCNVDTTGEIGHTCERDSFSFLNDKEEDIYTKEDGSCYEGKEKKE